MVEATYAIAEIAKWFVFFVKIYLHVQALLLPVLVLGYYKNQRFNHKKNG